MHQCCNPYKLHHTKKQSRGAKSVGDLDRCRTVFPNIHWSEDMRLCPRCRLKILKDFELLQIVKTGVQIAKANLQKQKEKAKSTGSRESENQKEREPNLNNQDDEQPCSSRQVLEQDRARKSAIFTPSASLTASSINQGPTSSGGTNSDASVGTDVKKANELNKSLQGVTISPARPSDIKRPGILRQKLKKLHQAASTAIKKVTGVEASPVGNKQRKCVYCSTLFGELCEKFQHQETRVDKYKLLTSIPKRYSINEVIAGAECTEYMAKNASRLKHKNGAFTFPSYKFGRPMDAAHEEIIENFYISDENSRASPNRRDVVQIRRRNGEKVTVEKRRILHNLSELYTEFKKKHPEVPVSLSKFSKLRPKNCVWPGHRGHHIVCVCEIHQNFEFLLEAVDCGLSVAEFVKQVVCTNETNELRPDCHLGLCSACPRNDFINNILQDALTDATISFRQWAHSDSTDIQEVSKPAADFEKEFFDYIPKIVEHEYITRKQSQFIRNLREKTLKETSAVTVQVDFAQNYTFIVQNAVQGFHWSNKQATVHPFVVHWWDAEEELIKYKTYCVISDETGHDADTFHVFRSAVIPMIKADFAALNLQKIYYVSDGAASQYKNYKNFANLVLHFEDYGITAEWHFTSTSHGKGTCDAISAIVKCCTRRQSLKPGEYITTPRQMFDFCNRTLTSDKLVFVYVPKQDVANQRPILDERYNGFKRIKGTRKHHAFKPTGGSIVAIGRTSDSEMYCSVDMKKHEATDYTDSNMTIGTFYAFYEGSNYQIGLLVEIDSDEGDAKFQMMKLNRRTRVATWQDQLLFSDVAFRDVLMEIEEPPTEDGISYTIPKETMTAIRSRYNAYKAAIMQNAS